MTSPDVEGVKPAKTRKRVDFPEPFAPINAVRQPQGISNVAPENASGAVGAAAAERFLDFIAMPLQGLLSAVE